MHSAAHRLYRHRRHRAGGGIHNPQRRGWAVYGCLLAFFSVLGGGVAAWQVCLQHLPPGQVPECGPGLDYMLEAMPLNKGAADDF